MITPFDVVIGDEEGYLYALNGETGEQLWFFISAVKGVSILPTERSFMAAGSVIDINKDDKRDVLMGSRNGIFYAFNGLDGKLLWKNHSVEPSGILAASYVDGKFVYFAESYGYLHKTSLKGRLLQRFEIAPLDEPQLVAMPQFNKRGLIVQGSTFSDQQSGFYQSAPFEEDRFEPIGKISSSAILADVDGKEGQEFIFITESGY